MSGCTGTDKPCIAILMAVYEPRMDWLRDQLESLNAQTYPNLKLYVRDDCSPTVSFDAIQSLVRDCIRTFPYEITRNEENLGSNGTFERLTQDAEGEYFAYCDQDDIWLPEKLTILERTIQESGALLACSDMYIIDGEGKTIANSITQIRRHHIFRSGTGLTDTLWYSNFASGCALLVNAKSAKAARPFNPYMYYDHYVTFFSANLGEISFVNRPLIYHREHGENQSSTMQGVVDRETYMEKRVSTVVNAVHWLVDYFPADSVLLKRLHEGLVWMEARQRYLNGEWSQARMIWKYRKYSPMASLFEIMMPFMPNFLFRFFVWASKKNYI